MAVTIVCAVALYAGNTASAGPERWSSKEVAPAPVVEPFSWTGFYIGGNLGANWTNYEFGNFFEDVDVFQQADEFFGDNNVNTSALTNGNGGGFGFAEFLFPGAGPEGTLFDVGSDDGLTGGGQLGFNKQWGHFVVGIEGDFNRTSTSRSQTFEGSQTNFFGATTSTGFRGLDFAVTDVTATRRAETDWTASARARLGWANGRVLLYVTGGAAWTHINVTADDIATTEFFDEIFIEDFNIPFTNGGGKGGGIFIPFSVGSITNTNLSRDEETVLGWTAGGGGEWAVNNMFSIGMEYRHSDFGSHTYNFDAHGGPIFPGPMKVDLENDQVTVRFNILLSHFFGH